MTDAPKPSNFPPPPAALPSIAANSGASFPPPSRRAGVAMPPPKPPMLNPNVGSLLQKGTNPFPSPADLENKQNTPIASVPKPERPQVPSVNKPARPSPPAAAQNKARESSPKQSSPDILPPIASQHSSEVTQSEDPKQPTQEVPLSPPPPSEKAAISPAVISPQTEKAARETKTVPQTTSDRVDMSGGLMGWLSKTVTESKLLSDVAGKAKYGMEQVLTTLDPGMKAFLNEDGVVEVYVAGAEAFHLRAVREGFEKVFAAVVVRGTPLAQADLPVVVDGSAKALELCAERVKRAVASRLAPVQAPLLTMQPFLFQMEERIFYSTRLLLQWKEHQMDAVGQAVKVPQDVVDYLKTRSKADGKEESVYSLSPTQAAKELYKQEESWAGPAPPFGYTDLLTMGLADLALQFMNLHTELSSETVLAEEATEKETEEK